MKTGIYWQDPKYALRPGRDFIFDPSLVLYLPLGKLDGASFMAKDAHGHLGTVTGALWRPNGRDFDGTDDRVGCGTDIFMAATFAGGFTMEAWLNVDTLDDDHQAAISIKGRLELGVNATTDKAYLFVHDDPGSYWILGDSAISTSQWYHIAGTWNGTTNKIFVNGVQQADTKTSNVPALDVSRAITIGAHYNGTARNLDGLIGEVRVHSRALSLLEIRRNYLATKWRYR